MSKMNVSFALG